MLVRVLRLLARLPLGWLQNAGVALGWLTYAVSPAYSARMRENLYSSGVCDSPKACKRLLRRVIGQTGAAVGELVTVWFGPEERVAGLVRCDTWDVVERARRAGRGVIFLTPHLGCFEIAGLYAGRRIPLTVLYRPPKHAFIEPLMVGGRGRFGAKVAPANMKGVRALYRALTRNEAIGVLPDQAPGVGEGAWADFFGRPAYTMTLVTRLQRATGAAVIMAYAERLPRGAGYVLHLEAAPDGHLDERAMNRAIEDLVRRCPEQYLWSYNRYKTPAGAEPPPATVETR